MADLVEDFGLIVAHPGQDDLAKMRNAWYFLMMVIGGIGVRDQKNCLYVPGWTTTVTSASSPADYSKPDYITLSKTYTDVSPNNTVRFRYNLTWTGDNLTTIVFQYDNGTTSPLFTTVTGGTMTLTYDGSGNLMGAVPS